MLLPFGGLVATSTVNSPVSSKCFFRIGVVARQSWLFCPSMIRALSAGAAAIGCETMAVARIAITVNRHRMDRHSLGIGVGMGYDEQTNKMVVRFHLQGNRPARV